MINRLHIGYPYALGGLVVGGLFLSLATVNLTAGSGFTHYFRFSLWP